MNKIIYLDAAASSLKPATVINAEMQFLRDDYANAGRGVCARAIAADKMVADARARVADFIGAVSDQIVFTSGATDGLNRVVNIIRATDGLKSTTRIAVSDLDHHSARLPWMAAAVSDMIVMPLNSEFDIDIENIPCADIMVITAMSNVLGRAQDVSAIIKAARAKNPNVITVVDAAQYVAHKQVDVKKWDADFVMFSGHKIGADTGLGVMYIKNPVRWVTDKFGGGMVNRVGVKKIIFNDVPYRFEAGTLPLTALAGVAAALDAWRGWNGGADLIGALYDAFAQNKRIRIYTRRDSALLSFNIDGMHPLDVGAMAGVHGMCMRVGNMCASWAMRAIGAGDAGLCRISVGPWNTREDIKRATDIILNIAK